MKINIKATNIVLSDATKEYLRKKIKNLEKLLVNIPLDLVKVDVELGRLTNHHKSGNIFRAEINCQIGRNLLRAVHEDRELTASIDIVKDEMAEEIKRYKEKKKTKNVNGARKFKKTR